MFLRGYTRLVVLCVVLGIVASEEGTCPVTKKDCTCNFSNDAEDGGESTLADTSSKSEMLAAAAGAMSPLLIGGAGLGIWKLLKRGGGDDSDDDRASSSMSTPRSQPPDYASRSGTVLSMDDDPNDQPEFNPRNNRSWGNDPPSGPRTNQGLNDPNSWMR